MKTKNYVICGLKNYHNFLKLLFLTYLFAGGVQFAMASSHLELIHTTVNKVNYFNQNMSNTQLKISLEKTRNYSYLYLKIQNQSKQAFQHFSQIMPFAKQKWLSKDPNHHGYHVSLYSGRINIKMLNALKPYKKKIIKIQYQPLLFCFYEEHHHIHKKFCGIYIKVVNKRFAQLLDQLLTHRAISRLHVSISENLRKDI